MVVLVIMPVMVVMIVVMMVMVMMPIIEMVMVIMIMVVMVVIMMMTVVVAFALQTAQTCTEGIAQRAISNVRARRACPLALNVVMVAFLHSAYFGLKADHFGAVFAQYASRRRDFAVGRVAARL